MLFVSNSSSRLLINDIINKINTLLKLKKSQSFYSPVAYFSWHLSPVSVSSVNQMSVFDFPWPGRDTNPSQVSSQQMLVLIYLYLRRMESLVSLDGKKITYILKSQQSWGLKWGLVGDRQRSYQLCQPCLLNSTAINYINYV